MTQQQQQQQHQVLAGEAASPQGFDPGAWKRTLARVSATASSGLVAPQLRRRTCSVVIYPGMCRPDTFDGPFQLNLQELDSAGELRALRAVDTVALDPMGDDRSDEARGEEEQVAPAGQALSMALARAAIWGVNGVALQPHEVALLWEIIGMGGRIVAGAAFMSHCTGIDPELTKKSLASVEVG